MGQNVYGQLGDGTTTRRNAPVQVSGLSGAQAIDGGGNHSLAVTSSPTDPVAGPPAVVSTIPTANETEVARTTNVMATFSEGMDASSISATTFKLTRKGSTTKLSAAIGYDAATDTAALDPTNPLRGGVAYKAVVTTEAKDTLGNLLDQNSTTTGSQQMAWFFTVR